MQTVQCFKFQIPLVSCWFIFVSNSDLSSASSPYQIQSSSWLSSVLQVSGSSCIRSAGGGASSNLTYAALLEREKKNGALLEKKKQKTHSSVAIFMSQRDKMQSCVCVLISTSSGQLPKPFWVPCPLDDQALFVPEPQLAVPFTGPLIFVFLAHITFLAGVWFTFSSSLFDSQFRT